MYSLFSLSAFSAENKNSPPFFRRGRQPSKRLVRSPIYPKTSAATKKEASF